jgi:acetoacetate decarboxylase
MDAQEVLTHLTTPLTAPPYPAVLNNRSREELYKTGRFIDREYLNIYYRTDPEALRQIVPEPLEIDDPVVRFEVMHMGDVGVSGSYTEAGIAVQVRFGEENGEYLHSMFLDSFSATVGGREMSAYPKVMGHPRLRVDGGTLIGELDFGSLRIATATMGYKHHALNLDEAAAQITVPTFMFKVIPGYDFRPRVADLVRTQITDITVKQAWTGPARLQLFEHALAPLADLPVREIVSASHILTDLSLSPIVPVFDYLDHGR